MVEPVGQYHSNDPRQADLFVAEATPATAGRPAVSPLEAEFFLAKASVDQLAEKIRSVTGSGPRLYWRDVGDYPASRLVQVHWLDRSGFFRDAATAMRHVLEYERIGAEEGSEAAMLFRDKARCRTESEAVARLDEEDGVVRVDPNRCNPKYKHGDR